MLSLETTGFHFTAISNAFCVASPSLNSANEGFRFLFYFQAMQSINMSHDAANSQMDVNVTFQFFL